MAVTPSADFLKEVKEYFQEQQKSPILQSRAMQSTQGKDAKTKLIATIAHFILLSTLISSTSIAQLSTMGTL